MTEPSESALGDLRAKAERCFRLADEVPDKLLREALMSYGRELMNRGSSGDAKGVAPSLSRSGPHPIFKY